MFSFEIVKVSFGTFVNRCGALRRPALWPSFGREPATNDNTVGIRQVLFALTWKGWPIASGHFAAFHHEAIIASSRILA
jgi:hypothetical protein